MGYRHYGPRGFFFFPPFAFFFGLFVLFMLFKTGIWIPLLIGGLIFAAMRHHHRHEFGGWEKRKHGHAWHRDWHQEWRGDWDSNDDDTPQKPKRDEYI
jgi:hypothetical protein